MKLCLKNSAGFLRSEKGSILFKIKVITVCLDIKIMFANTLKLVRIEGFSGEKCYLQTFHYPVTLYFTHGRRFSSSHV